MEGKECSIWYWRMNEQRVHLLTNKEAADKLEPHVDYKDARKKLIKLRLKLECVYLPNENYNKYRKGTFRSLMRRQSAV